MKHIQVLLITLLIVSITGCSNIDTNEDIKNEYKIFILPDNNTVKNNDIANIKVNESTEDEYTEEIRDKVNELMIQGDADIDWEVTDEGNIIYEGVTYYELNTIVNNIELPCDKEAFIKFIITTFKPITKDVYCLYENIEINSENEQDTSIIYDILYNTLNYKAIVNKYNKDVTWRFSIYEDSLRHVGVMYGCDSYIICSNIGEDRVIDMNESTNIENGGDKQYE